MIVISHSIIVTSGAMSTPKRQLKKEPSALSDSWGPEWSGCDLDSDAACSVDSKGWPASDAQPQDWHDWCDPDSTTDGGTGSTGTDWSDGWSSRDSWWNSESWSGSSSSNGGGQSNEIAGGDAAFMEELEQKLMGEAEAKEGEVAVVEDPTLGLTPKAKAAADELAKAIADLDNLPASHKLMIKMRRDSKNNPKYKAASTAAEKRTYKLEWLELQLKKVQKTAVHTKKVTEKKTTGGKFKSFDAIVELEGGRHNPANIQAAYDICTQCIKEGKSYYKYSKFSRRVKFLYVEEGFEEEEAEEWATETRAEIVTDDTDMGNGDGADGNDDANGTDKKTPPAKRVKTALAEALSKAALFKNKYVMHMGTATTLSPQLKEMGTWALSFEVPLAALVSALQKMQSSPFRKFFVQHDLAALKKKYRADVVSVELVSMMDEVEPELTKLGKLVWEINAMEIAKDKGPGGAKKKQKRTQHIGASVITNGNTNRLKA